MGSGSSAARSLSNEEAAALKSAVTEAPSLQQKLESLQAEAAEVAILRQKLQELEDAQKSFAGESAQPSDSQGCEELPKGTKASEAASSYKAEKGADAPHEASQAAVEDAAALEADKAAAASCQDIHHAALDGNVAAVRHFLREDPSCIEGSSLNSLRPLHRAAEFGHVAVVQLLLDEGADLEAKDGFGWTALHRAAFNGHLSVVETLLRAGAAADAADNGGGTPLHWAAAQGHLPVVERLLGAGAAVDAAYNIGGTPLHRAAFNGHLSVVETLLRAGAAMDAADNDSWTALHRAAFNGHLSVVERLLRAGAAVDAANNVGWTPLHVAAGEGHLDVVERLLGAGAAVDAANNDGRTPLHWAACGGHLPVVERLLRAGAAVDEADSDGWTPLHLAAYNGRLPVVERLLRAGAAMDAADNDGRKPFDLAKEKGHRQVMGVLDPVFVALLSGRNCRCSSFSERTLSDLKDEAQQKLAAVIKSLIGPDHQPLDEKKSLEELEIEGRFTLTAVVEVFDELSPLEFASVELPKEADGQSQHFAELQEMRRDAVRITSLVAEVAHGVLLIYSDKEAKPSIAAKDSESPEPPEGHQPCSKVFELLPEGVPFGEPVRLVVPVDAGATVAMRSSGRAWEALPTSSGGRYAEVAMDHFSFLQFFRRMMGSEQPEERPNPSVRRSLTCQRRHLMISGRFNKPERLKYLKKVEGALKRRGVPVYMVDVGPGQSYAMPTMAGLYYARMMVAFCTEDYGGLTGARYETFHELRYAWEKSLIIVPVLLCNEFPPKPPDEEGKIQNDFVFSNTMIRIDGMNLTAEGVAKELDEAWQRHGAIDINLD